MHTRDAFIKTIKIVPDTVKGLWNGLTDDENNQSLALKVIAAYGITLATPASPFVAACIATFGIKRMCLGAYYLGSSLYTLFPALINPKDTEPDPNPAIMKLQ